MHIDENDNRTPRERIDDTFLRHMLSESDAPKPRGGQDIGVQGNPPCNSQKNGAGSYGVIDFPLGMVYSPIQAWRRLYDAETALEQGTLFRELDKPLEVAFPMGRKGGSCCDKQH